MAVLFWSFKSFGSLEWQQQRKIQPSLLFNQICVDSSLTDSAYQGATYTINITFESIPAAADLELISGIMIGLPALPNWDNGNTWIAMTNVLYNDGL